jgi:hypothetical protein
MRRLIAGSVTAVAMLGALGGLAACSGASGSGPQAAHAVVVSPADRQLISDGYAPMHIHSALGDTGRNKSGAVQGVLLASPAYAQTVLGLDPVDGSPETIWAVPAGVVVDAPSWADYEDFTLSVTTPFPGEPQS